MAGTTQMATVKRFLFEHAFDAAAPLEEPTIAEDLSTEIIEDDQEPANTFSEEDLARAHAQGVAEGREQAAKETALTVEQRVAGAFDIIGARLSELFAHQQDAAERAASDATMVATAVARKMIPELYRRNAAGEIEHAVTSILDQMLENPTLKVRVSEQLSDGLSERIAPLTQQRGLTGRVSVTADPTLNEGDCRVEWAGGGAEFNAAARWHEIDAIIERNLGYTAAVIDDDPDTTVTNEAPAVDTTAESDGRNPSQDELEDNHG